MKWLAVVAIGACSSSGNPASGTDSAAVADGTSQVDSPVAAAGTGASQAICAGGTCTPGTVPTATVNVVSLMVDNGTGTIENRTYGYYIPGGLKDDGSPDGTPAVVFDFSRSGCGAGAAMPEFYRSQIGPVADANHFIVIELECLAGTTNPRHPETDCGTTCGATTTPSDNPYIQAAVLDATARFHLDPARRYLVGGSSSANMTRDAICSTSTTPHNSSLFRGIMTMGGGAQALLGSTAGVCPSGDRRTFWLMLMGKSSAADPYMTTNLTDHTVLGFDDTRAWWASYLGGCQAPQHSTTGTGTGVASDVYDYSGCTNTVNAGSPFFEAVAVTNGGHMWCGLDATTAGTQYCTTATNNTGGFSTAEFMWSYFASTTIE